MGTFSVQLLVGNLNGGRSVPVDALVDTGATYTTLPASILTGSGVQVLESRRFEMADGRIVEYDIGQARLGLNERELIAAVVFAPEDSSPLVGATTLELFGLGLDPVRQELMPVPGLLK